MLFATGVQRNTEDLPNFHKKSAWGLKTGHEGKIEGGACQGVVIAHMGYKTWHFDSGGFCKVCRNEMPGSSSQFGNSASLMAVFVPIPQSQIA